jgi:hypothetical protein
MQKSVMVLQMLHTLKPLQIGIRLTGLNAETMRKLTDKRHCVTDDIFFFAQHILSSLKGFL